MGDTLVFLGLVMVVAGIVLNLVHRAGFPTLPGDIFIQKENVTIYFPIVSSIVVSLVLALFFNLFR